MPDYGTAILAAVGMPKLARIPAHHITAVLTELCIRPRRVAARPMGSLLSPSLSLAELA
jgi:hypothetical protein